MTKTFREVIRDIKEGEVWENTNLTLAVKSVELSKHGGIRINHNSCFKDHVCVKDEAKFELQRPQYTFTEAFAEYEKGAKIESLVSGDKYCMKNGEKDLFYANEIRNKWYINKEDK